MSQTLERVLLIGFSLFLLGMAFPIFATVFNLGDLGSQGEQSIISQFEMDIDESISENHNITRTIQYTGEISVFSQTIEGSVEITFRFSLDNANSAKLLKTTIADDFIVVYINAVYINCYDILYYPGNQSRVVVFMNGGA